ncbi:MAG: hypothetical protein GY939_27020 [Actinomycetia bacterium]|nr:hypothetical protein [Actinomycetes bacterium]
MPLTVHGTRKDARLVVAELTVKPAGIRAPRLTSTKTGSRRVVTLSPLLTEMVETTRTKYGDITTWPPEWVPLPPFE